MRNKYPGICYRCGKFVETGAGHFERYQGHWRTQHANCTIEAREQRELDESTVKNSTSIES